MDDTTGFIEFEQQIGPGKGKGDEAITLGTECRHAGFATAGWQRRQGKHPEGKETISPIIARNPLQFVNGALNAASTFTSEA